jgi:histidinol phosphatase-like PHP family hydrolase
VILASKGFLMQAFLSRRSFLTRSAAAVGALGALATVTARNTALADPDSDIPRVDYHVHVEAAPTLDDLVAIAQQRGVKFGIVEHAGTKANKYPALLSNDEDLARHLKSLEGRPVYRGIQAEGLDWMGCFSKEMIGRLDYVLSDALTMPQKNGERWELWRPWVRVSDKQDFMDRYVDFHVQLMSVEPLDILANPTFLPACLAEEHEALWTSARMQTVIDAAVKYQVAIEINSQYLLPRAKFLELAQAAGVKFSFGSNIRGKEVGKLDYCLEMVRQFGLTRRELFAPAPAGQKPIQRRG